MTVFLQPLLAANFRYDSKLAILRTFLKMAFYFLCAKIE